MKFIKKLVKTLSGFVKKEAGAINLLDTAFAVGIGAALAAVVVPSGVAALQNAKSGALIDEIKNISGGLSNMLADTGRLPDDPTNIGIVIDFNGGTAFADADGKGISIVGLRENGTGDINAAGIEKGIVNWQGPYVTKEVVKNLFGGTYRLRYDLNIKDGATTSNTRGETRVRPRRDVLLQITDLPSNLQRLVDESLDDGVSNTGWVQTGRSKDENGEDGQVGDTDVTDIATLTRGDNPTDFDASDDLFVTIFPDMELSSFVKGL
ncbi:MAG: hypothetical protein ACUZ8E_04635 [Candidatus Anammoxibacter sp.]